MQRGDLRMLEEKLLKFGISFFFTPVQIVVYCSCGKLISANILFCLHTIK